MKNGLCEKHGGPRHVRSLSPERQSVRARAIGDVWKELPRLVGKKSQGQTISQPPNLSAAPGKKTAAQNRLVYIVNESDTPRSIAQTLFGDKRFGDLIITINRASVVYLETDAGSEAQLIPGSQLWLPSGLELDIYRRNYFVQNDKRDVSAKIINAEIISKERLSLSNRIAQPSRPERAQQIRQRGEPSPKLAEQIPVDVHSGAGQVATPNVPSLRRAITQLNSQILAEHISAGGGRQAVEKAKSKAVNDEIICFAPEKYADGAGGGASRTIRQQLCHVRFSGDRQSVTPQEMKTEPARSQARFLNRLSEAADSADTEPITAEALNNLGSSMINANCRILRGEDQLQSFFIKLQANFAGIWFTLVDYQSTASGQVLRQVYSQVGCTKSNMIVLPSAVARQLAEQDLRWNWHTYIKTYVAC